MPRPVTDRLAADVARQLAAPEFSSRLSAEAMAVLSLNADAFAALLRTNSAHYAWVIKRANIRAD